MTHRASRSSRAIADSSALNCKWPGRYREFIRISSCPLSSRPHSAVGVFKIRASFSGYANLLDTLFKKHQQRSKLRHGDFHSTTDTFRFGVLSRFAFKCARYNCAASLLMDRWARRKWQWWWNLIRLSARRGYRVSAASRQTWNRRLERTGWARPAICFRRKIESRSRWQAAVAVCVRPRSIACSNREDMELVSWAISISISVNI